MGARKKVREYDESNNQPAIIVREDGETWFKFRRSVSREELLGIAAGLLHDRLKQADVLSSPHLAREFLRVKLGDREREVFACIWLDNRHRVIEFEELFFGTIDGASVHPREVVKSALRHNAAAVLIAHCHPSGVAEPSAADRALTSRLQEALALVDVRLLDHIVVAATETVSFSERGLI